MVQREEVGLNNLFSNYQLDLVFERIKGLSKHCNKLNVKHTKCFISTIGCAV